MRGQAPASRRQPFTFNHQAGIVPMFLRQLDYLFTPRARKALCVRHRSLLRVAAGIFHTVRNLFAPEGERVPYRLGTPDISHA